MNRILTVFAVGFIICTFAACLDKEGTASTATDKTSHQNEAHGLILSVMQVKITSQGRTATFRLYDTIPGKHGL